MCFSTQVASASLSPVLTIHRSQAKSSSKTLNCKPLERTKRAQSHWSCGLLASLQGEMPKRGTEHVSSHSGTWTGTWFLIWASESTEGTQPGWGHSKPWDAHGHLSGVSGREGALTKGKPCQNDLCTNSHVLILWNRMEHS